MIEFPEFLIRFLDLLIGTILFLSVCSSFECREPKQEEYHWKEMK